MNISGDHKRSNTFGVQASLKRAWQRPSIPWSTSASQLSPDPEASTDHHTSYGYPCLSDAESEGAESEYTACDLPHLTQPEFFTTNFLAARPSRHKPTLPQRRPSPYVRSPPQSTPLARPQSTSSTDDLFAHLVNLPEGLEHQACVDLTGNASEDKMAPAKRNKKSEASIMSGQIKSYKRKHPSSRDASIEEIDLRDADSDEDLARVLEQQRVATVRDQQAQAEKPTKLANVTCVVCMEELTNMTATHCGHLFCHTCLMEALIAGENQGSEPGKGQSKCPICRKKVTRPKETRNPRSSAPQVIPLEIKFKARPPGSTNKGKGKA